MEPWMLASIPAGSEGALQVLAHGVAVRAAVVLADDLDRDEAALLVQELRGEVLLAHVQLEERDLAVPAPGFDLSQGERGDALAAPVGRDGDVRQVDRD